MEELPEAAQAAEPGEGDGQRPCILVVHASVGSGHKSAANAIAQALEMLRDEGDPLAPADLDVEVVDILDYGRIRFDGDKAASAFTGATRPFYDFTWRYSLTGRLLWGGGWSWARLMFPRFIALVEERHPRAIVCTHITGANVAVGARIATRQRFPIICVPTDYEVEGLWPHRYADRFCVANEFMAETLRPRLVPEDRIQVTGIPTRPAFSEEHDAKATRERFGLPQDKRVVLALAGANLPRPYVHFREAIDQVLPYAPTFHDLHLVIVAGNDEEYARHLRRACKELELPNVTVLEYVEDMAALMGTSDVVICKSGGLVVTECLCAKAPMILLGRAYGQEKANVSMLTAAGAAMHATTPRELIELLHYISAHPDSHQAMLVNASLLRKPDAAMDVARATLELSAPGQEPIQGALRRHFAQLYLGRKPAHTR